MAGLRTWLPMLAILALLALGSWIFQLSDDSGSNDADLVYCLAPAHQAGLVNAAVSLGLLGVGSTPAAVRAGKSVIPVSAWQARDSAGFQRACDAYAAPAFAGAGSSGGDRGDSGIGGILLVLIPVAVGSLLTLATDTFKQSADRNWEQVEALRGSWEAYRGMVETYVTARRRSSREAPANAELDELRRDLMAKLLRVQSRHRKSPTLRSLRDRLTWEPLRDPGTGELLRDPGTRELRRDPKTGELGGRIMTGWADGVTQDKVDERVKRADEVTSEVEKFDAALRRVAEKLERGIWLSRRL